MPAGWVEAGSAALGAYESIQGNKAAAGAQKLNNQVAQQNANAQGTMLNSAEQIANQPFQAYTGTLTAPMSGNQQQANSLASSSAGPGGQAAGLMGQATGLIDQVGANSNWNQATAQKYMNPYTQDVTNVALDQSNRDYLSNLSSMNERAAQSGAYGGGRNAIEQGELAGQNQLNDANIQATGNANAYDSAMNAWKADNGMKLSAANAYAQAGGDITRMNSQQVSDLLKSGGVSQVIAQTGLDAQYGQFMRQQNWSANQLGSLIKAVGATRGGVTQSAPVQSNTANQLLGLGSTLAGLWGGGSGSSPGAAAGSSPSSDISGGGSALSSSYFDPSQLQYNGGAMAATGTSPFGP